MNMKYLILAFILIGGVSMATTIPDNPYIDGKYLRAVCLRYIVWTGMNESVYTYNASYGPAISAIGPQLWASQMNLYNYFIDDDVAGFNGEYQNTFMPLMRQAISLYFRAASDYVRSGGSDWAAIMSEFMGFQQSYLHCLEYPPA